MNSLYVVVRVLHVLCGALWVGMAALTTVFLLPAVMDLGPDGQKMMAALERRRLVIVFPFIAAITVLSGVWLLWRYTAGFSPELSATHAGRAFSTGGALGIIAFILSAIIGPGLARARRLVDQAAAMPEGAARAALLTTAAALRRRGAVLGRVGLALLVATTILMAAALYV